MKKYLLFLMVFMTGAVTSYASYSVTTPEPDDGVTVIVTTDGYNQLPNNSNEWGQNAYDLLNSNRTNIIFKGKFSGNDLNKFQNAPLNKYTTVDFSGATFEANSQSFDKWKDNITTAILSETTTTYSNQIFEGCKKLTSIKYKDMVATVTMNTSNNQYTVTFTKSGVDADDTYFENVLKKFNGGNQLTVIANDPAAQTGFENGVLTIGESDADKTITDLINMLDNLSEQSDITQVVFPDGSTFDVATGKLTSSSSDVSTMQSWLTTNGFTLNTTEQKLGNYVSIVTEGNNDPVTNIQTNGVDNSNLDNWPDMTDAEKNAISSATNVKLNGAFTSNCLLAIKSKKSGETASRIQTLDLTDVSWPGTTALNNLTSDVVTLKLPTSMETVPEDFCNGMTSLQNLTIPEGIKKIGKNAFRSCTSLQNFTFPQSIEEIGIDAFYECLGLTTVDLRNLPNLWKIDAAAFNMGNGTIPATTLTTVLLPTTDNTTLTFFGNQVFSSSNVTSLDFSHCLGIRNFAYDGTYTNGEGDVQYSKATATFYWYKKLETVILPPNITNIGNECFTECDSLKSVTVPRVKTVGNSAFQGCGKLETITINTDPDEPSTIGESAFLNCVKLESVIINGTPLYDQCELKNPLEIKKEAFMNCTSLTSVQLPKNLISIGESAFNRADLTTVSIPASVEEIGTHAFDDNNHLSSVIFEDLDSQYKNGEYEEGSGNLTTCRTKQTHIAEKAFVNSESIFDVYINNPSKLKCDNLGFDLATTHGHGDAKSKVATLHFPQGQESYYVNQEHYLTDEIATDAGKFQKWLVDHLEKAKDHAEGYGWHEFVNAGPSAPIPDDPNYEGEPEIILRTFSDYNNAYIVPDGMRAYIVNGVKPVNGFFEATLFRIRVIPKQTGVILYGHPNGKDVNGKPTLVMTPAYFEEGNGLPLCRANWTKLSEDDAPYFKNYLEPTSTNPEPTEEEAAAHPEWKDGGKYIKPFDNVEGKDVWNKVNNKEEVAFRNFGLGRYQNTVHLSKNSETQLSDDDLRANGNYEGFFRLIKGYYPTGKAYLRLAASEYTDEDGAEVLVKKDSVNAEPYVPYYYESVIGDQSGGYYDATDSQFAERNYKGWWDASKGFAWNIATENFQYTDGDQTVTKERWNWGVRPSRFANPQLALKYFGEIEEDTDGVVKIYIPMETNDEACYTLQGVKVSNPGKGVYIRNGKKIIIK